MAMFKCTKFFVLLLPLIVNLLLFQSILLILAQQPYENNYQLDCYDDSTVNITRGYACNGVKSSCKSYLTFRSNPPYNSALYIAYLLNVKPSVITSVNELPSDITTIPTNTQVVVPVKCSCSRLKLYQHNSAYKILDDSENYYTIANDTYQGLTTCRAMMETNSIDSMNLGVGDNLTVPLRCACPTRKQVAAGVKYLLNYLPSWDDSVSSIAELFKVDERSVFDANELSEDLIYPFNTILVPLKIEPVKIAQPVFSSPPAPSPQLPLNPFVGSTSSSSRKWVFVGVGLGVAWLLLMALLTFLFSFYCRKSKKKRTMPVSSSETEPKIVLKSANNLPVPQAVSVPWQGYKSAVDSLTTYKFEDLQIATSDFMEENRIKGSVFKGCFNGDDIAIKVMDGDVSSEINILKKINHSNIINLSGFCMHEGKTFLVYEYARNGSLSNWLQSNNNQTSVNLLEWIQRVQIAYDVASAINYIHEYTYPPYIHKNLNTSNILLDSNFRAKIANFGLARRLNLEHHQGGLQMTGHIVGTHGYMAPEYIRNGVISPKLDVFAFGVVILELLSGREAIIDGQNGGDELLYASISRVVEGENAREKVKGFIDPRLRNEYPLDLAFSMAELAKNCVAHDVNSRPSMSEVFLTLSNILSAMLD